MALIRFIGAWDIHGSEQDREACRVFFEFNDIWKAKIRVCGGDLWNFAPLRKGACEDERRQSLKKDFKAGNKWFDDFKPTHFLRGNHDERLWELAENGDGVAADFAAGGVVEINRMVKSHRCKMLPYHKRKGVLRFGQLNMIHGFACGIYAARQTALVYGSTLFGHIHAIDQHAVPGLERRVARAVGALCKLDQPYNNRHPNTLRQAHGFPYGFVNDKTGSYHVFQAECVNGKWVLPSDFVELK